MEILCLVLQSTLKIVYALIGCPILIVVAAAPILQQSYVTSWSCWMNFGSRLAAVIVFPIVCISSVGLIIWEASEMYQRRHGVNLLVDRRQYHVAQVSKKFYALLVFLTSVSWFLGTQAVYYQRLWLFTATFAANVALGFAISFAHISSDQEVHLIWLKKLEKILEF